MLNFDAYSIIENRFLVLRFKYSLFLYRVKYYK